MPKRAGKRKPRPGSTVVVLNASISPEAMEWLDEMIEQKTFATRSHGVEKSIAIAREYYKKNKQ